MQQVSSQLTFGWNPKSFRRAANNVIKDFKKIPSGTATYPGKPRSRLLNTIYKATDIEPKKVTDEDRRLHEQLKSIYKRYETDEDYMNGLGGGGGCYADRSLDVHI